MGTQPPNSVIFLEIGAYTNRYSLVKGYFRFKKLSRNRYFTRYRAVELRCLLGSILCLYKYVDFVSKFLIKIYARKERPCYQKIPLAIDLLLHNWFQHFLCKRKAHSYQFSIDPIWSRSIWLQFKRGLYMSL